MKVMGTENWSMELINLDGFYITPSFVEIREEIENMEIRDEDIWFTGYPKSGTTWCQEMAYLLATDLNYERAKILLDLRIPSLEHDSAVEISRKIEKNRLSIDHKFLCRINVTELLKQAKHKRFIKTHLPFYMLPKEIRSGEKMPKIIHIIRNPKQVASSYYFFLSEMWPIFKGSMEDFVDLFIQGKVLFGSYSKTVPSFWNEKYRPNLLILIYEDIVNDLYGTIQKVANFLGKSYTEEQLKKLEHHLSFNVMKNNDAVNRKWLGGDAKNQFLRKGKVDSFKEELSPESIEKLDRWISEDLKIIGFPYKENE